MKTLLDRAPRTLTVGDEVVSVRVRESARARTARIIVGPRRPLEVIVPAGYSDADVDDMLAGKRRWIARKLAAAHEIATRPLQLGLSRVGVIWLEGRAWWLSACPVPVSLRASKRAG